MPSYDPIFVIEANFDGPPGPFWAQMEAAFGIQLRPMLRCCKRPADGDGPVYDAVTKPFSRYPLAPYLEKQDVASQRLPSGQPRPGARSHPAGRRALPGDPRWRWRNPARPTPIPIAASPPQEIHRKLRAAAARPLSLAGDAGAGAHFLGRTDRRIGAAPRLRLPRPLLPVDSRHGAGAGHAGLAVPHSDRAAGRGLVVFKLWRMRAPAPARASRRGRVDSRSADACQEQSDPVRRRGGLVVALYRRRRLAARRAARRA